MEEYHVRVESIKYAVNNDLKFTNRIIHTKYYVFLRRYAQTNYDFILTYIKKDIEYDADEIHITISRKGES